MASPSSVYINPAAKTWRRIPPDPTGHNAEPESPAQTFHRLLPNYAETPLHNLPSIAKALNLGHVLIKDESNRFGLPSFKVLGASWAVYRAVTRRLGIDAITFLDSHQRQPLDFGFLGSLAREQGLNLKLITCTEGNWGRAVARMAGYMGIPAVVYVPANTTETTRDLIRGEGADVRAVEGDYDCAVEAARLEAGAEGTLLVMDIGLEGYEMVPQWVVEGYQTMLDESDAQVLRLTGGQPATHAIVPVGCGSIAQAVTQHFKNAARERGGAPVAAVLVVEPDTAACLKTSLENGKMTSVATGDSIMCGMNCGTLSTTAWPVLKSGVDGAVVVSDADSHRAVQELGELGIKAGPCGAATLAALKRISEAEKRELGLGETSVVLLYCTEGPREYAVPV
ncbi:hypothetical protein VTK56DRAFT_7259 [Thermocarpiscus australiensis]